LLGQQDINFTALDLFNEIETDFFLLGATALEDKLQDEVPEVIEDFRTAGIKVWMLTGDKLETAENIGFSSQMFSNNMCIFRVNTVGEEATLERMQEALNMMISQRDSKQGSFKEENLEDEFKEDHWIRKPQKQVEKKTKKSV